MFPSNLKSRRSALAIEMFNKIFPAAGIEPWETTTDFHSLISHQDWLF